MTSLDLLLAADRDVAPNEWLLRYIKWVQTTDSGELTTAAFRDSAESSVDREKLLAASRVGLGDKFPYVGTTKFQTKDFVRAEVKADPIPENLAHAYYTIPDTVPGNRRALKAKLAEHLKKLAVVDWDAATCVVLRQAAERRSNS